MKCRVLRHYNIIFTKVHACTHLGVSRLQRVKSFVTLKIITVIVLFEFTRINKIHKMFFVCFVSKFQIDVTLRLVQKSAGVHI